MADPFDELARELDASGPDKRLVNTRNKLDPFDVLKTQMDAPASQMDATRYGAMHDLMVAGPLLEHGYQAGKAALGYDPSYTEKAVAANPEYRMLGGLLSNAAATGGLGATKYGAMALGGKALPFLGTLGENLGIRMGQGAASGGALGAADAYMRGENPALGGVVGGLAGGAAPALGGVVRGVVSPFNSPASPTITQRATQPGIDYLKGEGVRLSTGQSTQNPIMQSAEDILRHYPGVGGTAEDLAKRSHMDFTTAALRRAEPNLPEGTLATPEVINKTLGDLKTKLDTARNNTVLYPKQDYANDIATVRQAYRDATPLDTQTSREVNAWFDQMQRRLQQGSVPGEAYQRIRTDLRKAGEDAVKQGQTAAADAYFGMRRALDEQMNRDVHPQFAAEWRDLNRRYGNIKTIQDAMTTTTKDANRGFLSPSNLGNAIIARSGSNYARNAGPELTELARAGNAVLKPLPESGTGRQQIVAGLLAAGGGAALGGITGAQSDPENAGRAGVLGGGLGGAGGFLAAMTAGRAAISPTGQRILANRLLSSPRATSLAAGPLQQLMLPGRSPTTLRDLGE